MYDPNISELSYILPLLLSMIYKIQLYNHGREPFKATSLVFFCTLISLSLPKMEWLQKQPLTWENLLICLTLWPMSYTPWEREDYIPLSSINLGYYLYGSKPTLKISYFIWIANMMLDKVHLYFVNILSVLPSSSSSIYSFIQLVSEFSYSYSRMSEWQSRIVRNSIFQ